jgi:hypothetical protein
VHLLRGHDLTILGIEAAGVRGSKPGLVASVSAGGLGLERFPKRQGPFVPAQLQTGQRE